MSEEDTYLRAKLTEINGAIERLTGMLNRMIEVISVITEVQESNSELALIVAANSEKVDEVLQIVKNLSGRPVAASTGAKTEDKGALSSLQAVLDTLDSQVREGVIASDLSKKINESADSLEQSIGSGSLIVKMRRWTRILKTYGRVDPISPADLSKLRQDIKEWHKELGQKR
ncbi:MAG: hypothetical protein RTU92_06020 [Candidatus Thorarchaeota archaeon]